MWCHGRISLVPNMTIVFFPQILHYCKIRKRVTCLPVFSTIYQNGLCKSVLNQQKGTLFRSCNLKSTFFNFWPGKTQDSFNVHMYSLQLFDIIQFRNRTVCIVCIEIVTIFKYTFFLYLTNASLFNMSRWFVDQTLLFRMYEKWYT